MIVCFRANEKKELEAKQRIATAAGPPIAAAAASLGAAASSASQTELHELKKRNDELEDEVSSLGFEKPHGMSCFVALVLSETCSAKNVRKVKLKQKLAIEVM